MPLNDMQCRNAKPGIKRYRLYDTGGLYLEVSPSGGRHWFYKYRSFGKEKRLGIGAYPAISLLAARKLAAQASADRIQGRDPVLLKDQQKRQASVSAAETFEALGRLWHTEQSKKLEPKYAAELLRRLEKNLFPKLGKYPIRTVTTAQLADCLKAVETRAPHMARRMKQVCADIFRYAKETGRAAENPALDLRRADGLATKHHPCIKIAELPEFLKVLKQAEPQLDRVRLLAVRIVMLTAVRRNELMAARKAEFDFKADMWTIPPERMKRKVEHLVPLSSQAKRALLELFALSGDSEYLFPALTRNGTTMNKGLILQTLGDLNYGGRMSTHGFRALFMSIAKQELKYPHEIPDRQLAHLADNEIEQAYDRAEYLPQRVELMQRYADYIDGLDTQPKTLWRMNNYRPTYTTQPTGYSYTIAESAGNCGHQRKHLSGGNGSRPLPPAY